MGTTEESAPFDVVTDVNYFSPSVKEIDTKDWKTRVLGEKYDHTKKCTVHDIRGREDAFSLNQNGFQFIKLPTKTRQTDSDELIQQNYYPEVEEVLRKLCVLSPWAGGPGADTEP